MRFIQNFINQEIIYFKKLHADAQRLILSIILFSLVGPIFTIFVNAFLWRQSQDIILIAFYNLVLFTFILVAFYLNGILLNRYSVNRLYFIALALEGLSVVALIFLPTLSYLNVFLFSVANGLAAGMYWANRNLLTLKTTQSDDRIYFASLEIASSNINKVFIPLFIGWFITFGSTIHLYSPVQGYQIVSVVMLFIIGLIGVVMKKDSVKFPVAKLFLSKVSKGWQRFRLIQFIYGLNHGILAFVPTLIVLILVGNEETLGTIQSFSAILASLLIYLIAKRLDVKHRLILFSINVALLVLGASIFGIYYSALAVFVFFACQALASPFDWVAISSLNYDLIDKTNKADHYAYVCDQEIYLNAGRIVGITFFIAAIHFISNEFALRFAPFLVALLQIGLIFAARSAEKHHAKDALLIRSSIDQ